MRKGSLPTLRLFASALRNSSASTEAELGRCTIQSTASLFGRRDTSGAVEPQLHPSTSYTTWNYMGSRGFASVPLPASDDDANRPPPRPAPSPSNTNRSGPNTGAAPKQTSSGSRPPWTNNNNNNGPNRRPSTSNSSSTTSKGTGRPPWARPQQQQSNGDPSRPRPNNAWNINPNNPNPNNPNSRSSNGPQQQTRPRNPQQQQASRPPWNNNQGSNRPNNSQQSNRPRPPPTGSNNSNNNNNRGGTNTSYNSNNNHQQQQRPAFSPNQGQQRPAFNQQRPAFNQNQTQAPRPFNPRRKPVNDLRKNHWLYKDRPATAEQQQQNDQFRAPPAKKKAPVRKPAQPKEATVSIPDNVTVKHLAALLSTNTDALEKVLSDFGDTPRSDQEIVSPDSAELAALEYGRLAIFPTTTNTDTAVPRPPVVTVMGHVDHGKTSLLDALRSTSVAAKEAGGITQHIGAFEVALPGSNQSATFIDTPGHAAFTAMRARGAAVTDVVVLVVAAEDGVMPQTREAIAHARAAKCPMVVAITKVDLPGADPEKVRKQLIAEGLELEELGGNIQTVEVAAPLGQGLKELEEAVMLQAELLELKADTQVPASGVVVEARMDKGQGPTATIIVTKGTLKTGQAVVVGTEWGKVRALRGPGGGVLSSALPGQPAEIVGLRGLPLSGDDLLVVADEERAQRVSKARTERSEWRRHSAMARFVPEQHTAGEEGVEEGPKILPLVVKADVRGSVEAVRDAVSGLSSEHVIVKVIHAGVGPVSLSDVQLAVPSGAKVFGFNVRAASEAEAEAKRHGINLVCRRVIYELLDDVANAVEGAAPKVRQEVIAGVAEVLQVFSLTGKRGKKEIQSALIAGCRVTEGSIKSDLVYRVLRGGEVVWEGRAQSLKRHKLEVDAVGKGTECGVRLNGYDEVKLGDVLHCIDEKL